MDKVKEINFKGTIEASKSLMNRALIVQSFFPSLEVLGQSSSEDVIALESCLKKNFNGKTDFHCGAGGTTFRFLLARLSRQSGVFTISGTKRLMERPHSELFDALVSLGCHVEKLSDDKIKLHSEGWRIGDSLKMSLSKSSQFVSSLLLSSWNLERPLKIQLNEPIKPGTYLWMTVELLRSLGMGLEVDESSVLIPAGQKCDASTYRVESDMSSIFALIAFALVNGEIQLEHFPRNSIQPDFDSLSIVKQMNGDYQIVGDAFILKRTEGYKPIEVSLKKTPDLFPVLSVLLSRVEGRSILTDLEVLKFKESDRLKRTIELLGLLGVSVDATEKSLVIHGKKSHNYPKRFQFNPDHDHRMAMAAALAVHQGASIEILDKKVVNKSFPRFWELVGQ